MQQAPIQQNQQTPVEAQGMQDSSVVSGTRYQMQKMQSMPQTGVDSNGFTQTQMMSGAATGAHKSLPFAANQSTGVDATGLAQNSEVLSYFSGVMKPGLPTTGVDATGLNAGLGPLSYGYFGDFSRLDGSQATRAQKEITFGTRDYALPTDGMANSNSEQIRQSLVKHGPMHFERPDTKDPTD
jgi:hypothetical protein